MKEEIQLQVLICTMGEAGIRRVAEGKHPLVAGVEYLVSWQLPDGDCPIPAALQRPDFKFFKIYSRGIAKNRNHALTIASAPCAIMTDDDTWFSEEQLQMVIRSHMNNPDYGIITFKYYSEFYPKKYPQQEFNLNHQPKGYFVSCIEITFKPGMIVNNVYFNEHFGFYTTFHGGEEDVFIYDCLKFGIKAKFIPTYMCTHQNSTTGERDCQNPKLIMSKGAIFAHIHPYSWIPRMLVHAYRYGNTYGMKEFIPYCVYWLKGVGKALKLQVFRDRIEAQ